MWSGVARREVPGEHHRNLPGRRQGEGPADTCERLHRAARSALAVTYPLHVHAKLADGVRTTRRADPLTALRRGPRPPALEAAPRTASHRVRHTRHHRPRHRRHHARLGGQRPVAGARRRTARPCQPRRDDPPRPPGGHHPPRRHGRRPPLPARPRRSLTTNSSTPPSATSPGPPDCRRRAEDECHHSPAPGHHLPAPSNPRIRSEFHGVAVGGPRPDQQGRNVARTDWWHHQWQGPGRARRGELRPPRQACSQTPSSAAAPTTTTSARPLGPPKATRRSAGVFDAASERVMDVVADP